MSLRHRFSAYALLLLALASCATPSSVDRAPARKDGPDAACLELLKNHFTELAGARFTDPSRALKLSLGAMLAPVDGALSKDPEVTADSFTQLLTKRSLLTLKQSRPDPAVVSRLVAKWKGPAAAAANQKSRGWLRSEDSSAYLEGNYGNVFSNATPELERLLFAYYYLEAKPKDIPSPLLIGVFNTLTRYGPFQVLRSEGSQSFDEKFSLIASAWHLARERLKTTPDRLDNETVEFLLHTVFKNREAMTTFGLELVRVLSARNAHSPETQDFARTFVRQTLLPRQALEACAQTQPTEVDWLQKLFTGWDMARWGNGESDASKTEKKVAQPAAVAAISAAATPAVAGVFLNFAFRLVSESQGPEIDGAAIAYFEKSGRALGALQTVVGKLKEANLPLAGFLSKTELAELPARHRLQEVIAAVARSGSDDQQREAARLAVTAYFAKRSALSQTERKAYETSFSFLKEQTGTALARSLLLSPALGVDLRVAELLRRQSELDGQLKDVLAGYIQANAPPQGSTWMQVLEKLPVSRRYSYCLDVLMKNGASVEAVARLITGFEPIEGVREAVIDFLNTSAHMQSNRTDFTHEQIAAMFPNHKYARYFPLSFPTNLTDGPIRTRLIIAVFTAGSRTLNRVWLSEKLDATEVWEGPPSVMGYRPALGFHRLTSQLSSRFAGESLSQTTPGRQARGIIVQGAYERQGFTLMDRLVSRGDATVEADAANLRTAIEASLRDGALSKEPALVQRLFSYFWNLDASGSLIERIRDRAIWIAAQQSAFWDLRVEIHNFPTHDVLSRVKKHRGAYNFTGQWAEVGSQIDTLIREIERLLGVSAGTPNAFADALAAMPSTEARLAALKAKAEGFDGLTSLSRLALIQTLRTEWLSGLRTSDERHRRIKAFIGDRTLSDQAQVVASKAISEIESIGTEKELEAVLHLSRGVIAQVHQDDLLDERVSELYQARLAEIASESSLSIERRAELMSLLIRNCVDQIYFRLNREFGKQDEMTAKTVVRRDEATFRPTRFIDLIMRSSNAFMLSKLGERILEIGNSKKGIEHSIGDSKAKSYVEIYTPGTSIGILRFNTTPSQLKSGDIAVFDRMPAQMPPVAGIISVGVGARLSHLQLLSRALRIPNVKVNRDLLEALRTLDGKKVAISTDREGRLTVKECPEGALADPRATGENVDVPVPDHSVRKPLSFAEAARLPAGFAGPKGTQLAKMHAAPSLHDATVDGIILPFGLFDEYARKTGLKGLLTSLRYLDTRNEYLVAEISGKIRALIHKSPIPPEIMKEIMARVTELQARTGGAFFFVRSDTNVEDLPGFNGAGLNKSVANVPLDAAKLEAAIRAVWASPFEERSLKWRALALGSDRSVNAEPSVVIMPTVQAASSGVILSKGGQDWLAGRGNLSANWGIGSTVEADLPVDEYTLEGNGPLQFGFSVAVSTPVPDEKGGLKYETVVTGSSVLTRAQIETLNRLAQEVEAVLGKQPRGWDIEWVVDLQGKVGILQARPNM